MDRVVQKVASLEVQRPIVQDYLTSLANELHTLCNDRFPEIETNLGTCDDSLATDAWLAKGLFLFVSISNTIM